MGDVDLKILARSHVYHPETNHFISERVQRVAEVIADYNPGLRMAHDPSNKTYPFAILHFPEIGEPYVVTLLKEEEIDANVVAHLYLNDSTKNDPMEYLDKLEQAEKDIQRLREEEQRAEMHDRAKSIFRTPFHTYRLGGGKKVEL